MDDVSLRACLFTLFFRFRKIDFLCQSEQTQYEVHTYFIIFSVRLFGLMFKSLGSALQKQSRVSLIWSFVDKDISMVKK
jgi:hypothetical protein